ncbi:unnamed protein product [Spirodela intermedia]|uniref:Uncharacterized protein n=2 Tax=Spirodela intermedia TaxID=51605 RepID=A0A7I8JR16_SPIIN|nr:unnamed protein product [Spirodela intermedia]CAA6672023.1 unnamed protein product [Spirodela intermedia]CAA7409184.1 unnamed protein product [Spirodela intermedia]
MSLRYACRIAAQVGVRAAQAAKEQTVRSIKDAAASASSASSSSSKQVRRFSSSGSGPSSGGAGLRGAGCAAVRSEARRRRAEESLRTVMFLSCWGPN